MFSATFDIILDLLTSLSVSYLCEWWAIELTWIWDYVAIYLFPKWGNGHLATSQFKLN